MLSRFQLSGAMRPVFISLFLFSSIMAKDNSQISVQQRFVPGAVKLSINSGNALVLLSHSSDSGSIKIKIEKIQLSKRYLHIVREIPIIKSVSIEHISDMNGLITISLDRASEYDYDLKIKNQVHQRRVLHYRRKTQAYGKLCRRLRGIPHCYKIAGRGLPRVILRNRSDQGVYRAV